MLNDLWPNGTEVVVNECGYRISSKKNSLKGDLFKDIFLVTLNRDYISLRWGLEEENLWPLSDQWLQFWMTSGNPLFSIVLRIRRGTGGRGVCMQIETCPDHAATVVFSCFSLDSRSSIQEATVWLTSMSSLQHSRWCMNYTPYKSNVCRKIHLFYITSFSVGYCDLAVWGEQI